MRHALALLLVLPLAASGCALTALSTAERAADKTVAELYLAEIRSTLTRSPGVDSRAVHRDGSPIFDIRHSQVPERSGIALTVPVKDDLPADSVLEILAAANEAKHEARGNMITFVRRGGTGAESTVREPLYDTEATRNSIRHWWTMSTPPGVSVDQDAYRVGSALVVDATSIPDSSPHAVPAIDRLRNLLVDPPAEPTTSGYEQWTVRDRGPAITITARAGHLLDQDLWDGLTVPALDGLVESIDINSRDSGRMGETMTADRSHVLRDLPARGEETPASATVTLDNSESPLFSPEVIRALNAVPGLRYLQLKIDFRNPGDIGYTIDLARCSGETAEYRLAEADGTLPASAPAPASTSTSTSTATLSRPPSTTRTHPRSAPGDATTEAMNTAWEFWDQLGCE